MTQVSEREYLIEFDSRKCTQCHGCEIACKAWRDLGYGVQYRRVINLWQGEYPNVKNASLSMVCLHCVEPACGAACPQNAISKNEADGLVVVDETLCDGCGMCAPACPFGVPQFAATGIMQKCDLCRDRQPGPARPPCVDTCPGKALSYMEVSRADKQAREASIKRLLAGNGPSSGD